MSGIVASIKNLFQTNAEAKAEEATAEVEQNKEQESASANEQPSKGKHGDPGVCCGGCS
ncbi:MAG TPA: CCGSCS motif protein [Alcanivoracaceae bacterium]|nr:CCGSCS motif protein [Alcanivoracaceae bacterium]